MKRKLVTILVLLIGLFGTSHISFASDQTSSTSPSLVEIKSAITEIGLKHDIPPEILKAIAYNESGFTQFKADGSPFISPDGGIGLMQITPDKVNFPIDTEKLKTDYKYNIEVGAEVLDSKWKQDYLPKINNHDRHILEDWYFPIMAYNGASKINDPNLHPENTYQDGVYNRLATASLIDDSGKHFEFPTFDILYKDSDTMVFPENKDYVTKEETQSQQMYEPGDIVYIDGRDGAVNLHKKSIDDSNTVKLWPYTPLTVESGPYESASIGNDFVYYKVKGINNEGYIASSYLDKGTEKLIFPDAGDDQRAAALTFMELNGYAHGYPNGLFGSSDSLKREHVAVILDNILYLSIPSGYQMKADDVSKSNPYYLQLEKVEAHGYLGGGGKLRPSEFLSRSQMAQVMVEAFNNDYKTPTTIHRFKDQSSIWNPDEVNTIYFNNVTVSDPFLPGQSITRSQFAIFIYRTMVDYQ